MSYTNRIHKNMTKRFTQLLIKGAVVLTLGLLFNFEMRAQSNAKVGLDDTIHQIEDARNHYASLKALSSAPRSDDQWLDTISFDPPQYNNRSILYTLVEPKYLSNNQVEFLSNSISFPANSSEQVRAELDYLLKLQGSRSAELIKEVLEIAKVGYWPEIDEVPTHDGYMENLAHLFYECTEVVGARCTADNYPKTAQLLKNIMVDTRIMEYTVKYKLLRPRPYQLDRTLEPLQIMTTPSFASGHTLWAYTQAYAWSELMPDKRKTFLDLAYDIGHSREVMGIHYPSDEEFARNIAHRMLFLMWHNSEFQADLHQAKKEWK